MESEVCTKALSHRVKSVLYLLAVGSFPGQFLYYLAYEKSCDAFQATAFWKESSFFSTSLFAAVEFLSYSLSGIAAEFASSFAYLPCDIITQRIQTNQRRSFFPIRLQQNSAFSIIRHVLKTEGPTGLFRGFFSYNLTYAPSSAIWWLGYELSQSVVPIKSSDGILSQFKTLLCGCFAGALTSFSINPFEVAKTRLQLLESANSNDRKVIRRGFFYILKGVFKKEGVAGLMKGVHLRLLFRVPGSAISILGYETIKSLSAAGN